jgi:hypothetical protein
VEADLMALRHNPQTRKTTMMTEEKKPGCWSASARNFASATSKRPITFQFSLHRITELGELEHESFLLLDSGDPPMEFAMSLIKACGTMEPVFVYNLQFEKTRLAELGERLPSLRQPLKAIEARLVDLLPVAQDHFYHPDQQGSWSIKDVLPAVVSGWSYDDLGDIKDGGRAMDAFVEAIDPSTNAERKARLEQFLINYCKLDTYAMVRIWQVVARRQELKL